MKLEVKEVSRVSHIVRIPFHNEGSFKLLCMTDIHFDSVNCRRNLLKRHLDQAKAENARILIPGDWNDLMQGMYDPRRSYDDIRPEYKSSMYIDCVVDDGAKFLSPYAHLILGIGLGNHETNIIKRLQTNPTERLVEKLAHLTGHKPAYLGYQGYLTLKFHLSKSGNVATKVIKYNHGQRSNARRSKGVLQVDIDGSRWPDADIVIKGDDHQKWCYPSEVRERIDSRTGKIFKQTQYHIRCGSYTDGIGDGFAGWPVEKGFKETKNGGWWITFDKCGTSDTGRKERVKITIIEAE